MLHDAGTWIVSHPMLLTVLGIVSTALLALTVFATPWLIARLPPDYFRIERAPVRSRGARRALLLVVRNVAGLAFVMLGLVMVVTPGPGLVGVLLGLSLCEFPGKHRLLRALVARPSVLASLNWLRARRGSPPFHAPHR